MDLAGGRGRSHGSREAAHRDVEGGQPLLPSPGRRFPPGAPARSAATAVAPGQAWRARLCAASSARASSARRDRYLAAPPRRPPCFAFWWSDLRSVSHFPRSTATSVPSLGTRPRPRRSSVPRGSGRSVRVGWRRGRPTGPPCRPACPSRCCPRVHPHLDGAGPPDGPHSERVLHRQRLLGLDHALVALAGHGGLDVEERVDRLQVNTGGVGRAGRAEPRLHHRPVAEGGARPAPRRGGGRWPCRGRGARTAGRRRRMSRSVDGPCDLGRWSATNCP